MIRGVCRFALAAIACLVVIEVVLGVAAIGGWLRFTVALAIAVGALFMLPRELGRFAADEERIR